MATETVHFAAQWKGRDYKTGLCAQWAMSPRFMLVTDDKAKVNCTRCAKKLGVAPAAKSQPKNLGTCPCCFRSQKTLKGARMVHHGYNRPGYGYIVGDCFGVRYPRFEDSCEGTVAYRAHLEAIRARREDYLSRLRNDKVESILFERQTRYNEDGTRCRDRWGCPSHRTVIVNVSRGDAEVGNRYDSEKWIPSFEALREQDMVAAGREIDMLTSDIQELGKVIENWKPVA